MELEHGRKVSQPAPLHAPSPMTAQVGCFSPKRARVPTEDRVGRASRERPRGAVGEGERGTRCRRAARPGEFDGVSTIRAWMSGPKWNANRKACLPVVSRQSTISIRRSLAGQAHRPAVDGRAGSETP